MYPASEKDGLSAGTAPANSAFNTVMITDELLVSENQYSCYSMSING